MENKLMDIFNEYRIEYTQFTCEEMLNKAYNLFENDILYTPEISDEYNYLAIYHENVKKDYESAKNTIQ